MKIPDFLNENAENEDIYNRYSIVESIYNNIKDNKKYWVKIWLYWKWGVWKTFILNQLKNRINYEVKSWKYISAEPKVIFLSIKDVDNIEDVFSYFLEDIRHSFGIFKDTFFFTIKLSVSLFLVIVALSYIFSFWITFIQSFNKSFRIDLNSLIQAKNIIWISLSLFLTLIVTGFFKFIFSKNFFSWYNKYYDWVLITLYLFTKKFLWRKVLIIVDDLDRLKPDFLPEILLWLNRISTINKWIVDLIISADPLKLSEWIKKSNSQYSWNEWYEFLEKIIDIPYYIDDLPNNNKNIFLNKYRYYLHKDYEHFRYIENFVNLLPDNIRQTKRYFRFLYSYIEQLKRYWNEEINFELLFVILLFKLQNPKECLEFIFKINNSDIGKVLSEDKKSIEFEKQFSEIQKPYFRYIKDVFLFNDNILNYYYFFDNLKRVTDKEFYDDYLKWDKNFNDFKNCYDWDYIEIMLKLSYFKEKYYGYLISSTTNEMHLYSSYLETIYNFIEKALSSFQFVYYIQNEKLNLILRSLISYSNFNLKKSWVDFLSHRNKDRQLILKLVKKLSPEISFREVSTTGNFDFLSETVEKIYWQSILDKIDNEKIKLFDYQIRDFIYKKIITENLVDSLIDIKIENDITNENMYNILYIILLKIIEDWIELKFNKKLHKLFRKIKFSLINFRDLGSFKQDILNKLPKDYETDLEYIYNEVNKYIINKT